MFSLPIAFESAAKNWLPLAQSIFRHEEATGLSQTIAFESAGSSLYSGRDPDRRQRMLNPPICHEQSRGRHRPERDDLRQR